MFELERVLDWREHGWVTADTHVHFLSPQTALLEGAAEGVNVVNLLASQWGEMFSNVGDFDGATTIRREGVRRRRRVPRPRRHREPDAGARAHLAARLRRQHDRPALHRRAQRGGARRSARDDDGRLGAALHRAGRAGRHAARARSAAGAGRRHRARARARRRDDDVQPAPPGVRPAEPVRPGRLVPLPQPRLPPAPGGRLRQDGRGQPARRRAHLRPAGRRAS